MLENKLGVEADLIAWPFGLYDDELLVEARDAGYHAGFTLDRRFVMPCEPIMALPRFLVTDADAGHHFTSMLPENNR